MTNLALWSLQAAALVAVTALAARCMRTVRPSARLALWQLTLLAAVLLPLMRPWQGEVVAVAPVAVHGAAVAAPRTSSPAPAPLLPTPGQALRYLLAAGVIMKLSQLALGFLRLRKYRRESRHFGNRPEAEILISDAVPSPVTFGFLRPVILLPGHFVSLEAPLRETILYHEILHVRRRDWLFAVAEETIRAILWFHPAIWWSVREIHLAREEAVDREVVETMNAREAYVDALLAIAGTPLGRQWAPAPFFIRRKQLKQRVISIFREVNMSKKRSVSALLAGCCALALSCWFITDALPLRAAPQEVVDGAGVTVDAGGARLMHRPSLPYPVGATTGGTVVAQVRTNASGSVVDASIVSGPDELRKAVLESLLQWHFARDSANSTRQVSVTFTAPAAPDVAVHLGPPAQAEPRPGMVLPQMTIVGIDVVGLSDADRDQLLAQIPAHVGDSYTPELRLEVQKAARSFDEHLAVGMMVKSQGAGANQVTLRIAAPGSGIGVMPVTAARRPAQAGAMAAAETPAPASAPGRPVRIGGAVVAANLLNHVPPVYPPLAKAARVEGTVEFEVTIGTDGTVQNLHLISGPPLLVQAAMQAVQQWTYKPTLLNGQPVEVLTTVSVNFELQPN